MRKASQKEAQTKEMKDLTWEVGEIGGGGFSDLTQIKKNTKLVIRRAKKTRFSDVVL